MIIKKRFINIFLFCVYFSLPYTVSTAQVAQNDTISTFTNVASVIHVRANDTGADYYTGDYCALIAPQHGTIQILNQDSIRYIPAFDFAGTDEFVYSISLNEDSCEPITDTARVIIQVEKSGLTLLARWDQDTLTASGSISYNDIWGYTDCTGNEYAIMGSMEYVHFFDLKNDQSPLEVAAIFGGSRSLWRDIKTYQDRAYSVADQGNEGLLIFDLSDLPQQVTLSNQVDEDFLRSHNIFIDEGQGRLYVVGANSFAGGLIVYDLTQNPDEPVLMANISLAPFFGGSGGYVHDIFVRGNIAYCSHGGAGLSVYDLNDVNNPILLGNIDGYQEEGYNHASWLSDDGNYIVFADETHGKSLKMVDAHDFGDMSVIDLFKSENLAPSVGNSIAHNPFIRGNYIIASYYHDGIQIFDMTNPEMVKKVAFYDTEPNNTNYSGFAGAWGVFPFLPSGRIIASDVANGLMILSADNILFDSIMKPVYPDVTLTQSGDEALCLGDSLNLSVADGAAIYQWSNGGAVLSDSTHNLMITDEGAYVVEAANKYCIIRSDTVFVTLDTLPNADLELIGTPEICEDETVILQITNPNTINFNWLKDEQALGENSNALSINESGVYQLLAVNGACTVHSETVDVIVSTYPDVTLEIDGDLEFCPDATLQLSVSAAAEAYQWWQNDMEIEQATGHQFSPTSSGTYSLLANNRSCISISENVEVTVFEVETPTITLDNNHILFSTAAVAYQWIRDEEPIVGANNQSYTALGSGTYWVATTSEDGCVTASNKIEVSLASIHNVYLKSLEIYPNPVTDDILYIVPDYIENQEYVLTLFDVTGKLMIKENGYLRDNKKISLDVHGLAAGIYVLQLMGEQVQLIERVVIK